MYRSVKKALEALLQKSYGSEETRRLYQALVERACTPTFFSDHRVPDGFDGRFELLVLFLVLVLERLETSGEARPRAFGQALFDLFVFDMDQNLRKQGAGDIKAARHMTRIGEAFYGRQKAYREALESGNTQAFAAALERNLFGTVRLESQAERENVKAAAGNLADKFISLRCELATLPLPLLLQGHLFDV